MNREFFRVALIGYGLAGSVFHAPLIAHTKELRLAAIVTANAERAEKARRDFPQTKVLADSAAVFAAAGEYDVVVIAAPNWFHYSLAKASLEAGCATVVDKPVATSSTEVEELIAVSRRHNQVLTVFHNRRWDNDFLTLKKLIGQDLLGTITTLESRYERFRPAPKPGAWRESSHQQDAGGLLFDLGSHLIDQACVLFGRPRTVYAEISQRRPGALVDDDVFLALQFDNDLRAHLWTSSVARIKGPRFRLMGLRGSFEKYGLDPQEELLRMGSRPDYPTWGREAEALWGRIATECGGIAIDGKVETEPGAYEQFYANLVQVLQKKNQLAVKPEEALLTMRVIEAAQQSAKDRRLVDLT